MAPLFRLFLAATLLLAGGGYADDRCQGQRPNIILIMTDGQDLRLGSLDYMKSVQKELVSKGTSFSNHFATVSQSSPSRVSLFRGQHAHNTNFTHVADPGGSYAQWLASGQDKDYLPFWLNKAGYHTEYIGKFMSGYNTTLYREHPKAWHKVDLLLDPWTHDYNTPVFSKNGMTPVVYHGYHQTDVIRAKALDRLLSLTTEQKHKPFYLTIAPVAPHVEFGGIPKPQVRHKHAFPEAKAPQHANFNPTVSFAQQKPSWLKGLKPLNDSEIDHVNMHFRHRIQALQGVDEIVHDVVKLLEENGALDNTYIIYTTDNGYHLGQHRVMAGNTLPYLEDTNLPFIVRGPGVPGGEISRLPGAHLDLAPTFLDIACVHPHNVPVYFDGRSLLDNWHKPLRFPSGSESANRDIINGEFWGRSVVEAPGYEGSINNSYKTIRIVGRETAWLYSKWCTGDTELYESFFDIFELENLVEKAAPGSVQARIMHRLDALLMLTKTCSQDFCRDPWAMLQSTCFLDNSCPHSRIFNSIGSAMDPRFDDFFAKLPKVQMADCLEYQNVRNGSSSSLGSKPTNNYKSPTRPSRPVPGNALDQGTLSQRHTQISEMEEKARKLTDAELGIFSS